MFGKVVPVGDDVVEVGLAFTAYIWESEYVRCAGFRFCCGNVCCFVLGVDEYSWISLADGWNLAEFGYYVPDRLRRFFVHADDNVELRRRLV